MSQHDRKLILEKVKALSKAGIEGDIIECGCARGGTTAIMSLFTKGHGISKTIYALDTFSGFDIQELDVQRVKGLASASQTAFAKNSYEYVSRKMQRLGCDNVILVEGRFQDTLDKVINGKHFCFAFIDCDLADSMTFCMEKIWSKLSNGGVMFCDDYANAGFIGARESISQFVKTHENEIAEHGAIGLTMNIYSMTKDKK